MIRSMTGYGRAQAQTSAGPVRVEIKTTNHKYLELSLRLPPYLSDSEEALRRTLSDGIRRGKANVFVAAPDPQTITTHLKINEPLAREIRDKVRRLCRALGLKTVGAGSREEEAAILREVLRHPEVLTRDTSTDGQPAMAAQLERAAKAALEALRRSRDAEGRALEKDFRSRLGEMKRSVGTVEKRIPQLAREFRRALEARMGEFLKDGQLDRERVTLEVALYLKNTDISEEVTRFKSHLEALSAALGEKGEVGRKIDFIAQEMTRESNTMGAKSTDAAISAEVIRLKSAIEKIREQAQNVE